MGSCKAPKKSSNSHKYIARRTHYCLRLRLGSGLLCVGVAARGLRDLPLLFLSSTRACPMLGPFFATVVSVPSWLPLGVVVLVDDRLSSCLLLSAFPLPLLLRALECPLDAERLLETELRAPVVSRPRRCGWGPPARWLSAAPAGDEGSWEGR